MSYPEFYNNISTIKVQDPLSSILGSIDNGEYEFSYLEIVKSAGHSCPTVAGAYLVTQAALEMLYPNQRAIRGEIRVEFKENMQEGVAGVIGNIVSQITGATDKSGFKGLNTKFARHSLMSFNADTQSSARFTRLDTNQTIEVTYNPSLVMPNPDMHILMQKILQGSASSDEIKEFGVLWQDRVKRIFDNKERVIFIENVK